MRTPTPPIPPRLAAALADRYTLERELGRGGSATVYLATDLKHGRRVALKVLAPDLAAVVGPDRFLREIETTANLRHPHILPLFDSGRAVAPPAPDADERAGPEVFLYYVMPWVDGESLRDRLDREPQLPLDEAVRIVGQVADALAHAHARGVVHRDVKPENILLEDGHAVVADFGIARAIEAAGRETLTRTGMAVGTPAYMSPEQATGSDALDARSDVYALGCLLYEMLAGSPPFTGSTPRAVIARHTIDPPPDLRTVRGAVPAPLAATTQKALAKVPADRFADAAEFRDAVLGAGSEAPASVWRRRRRVWVGSALAALLATLGLLGYLASGGPSDLEAGRVMVFPLVVPEGVPESPTLGEDVATIVGSALDGVGPLRWIDGWTLLDPDLRNDARRLTLEEARRLARERGSRWFVTGRVVRRGDSADVSLALHETASEVPAAAASATAALPWRAALRALNGLLPTLIPGGAADLTDPWNDLSPGALANFLLGEASFRRFRLGEALAHYRRAVELDSTFALAALRGAQAASWHHRPTEAASLVALAEGQPLPSRYAAFARGYRHYLEGRADSAVGAFREAVSEDPDMAVAWQQMAETYVHLLPRAGSPDALAEAALREVRRLDPDAAYALGHLAEIRLRRGDAEGSRPLVALLRAAQPDDTVPVAKLTILTECLGEGPSGMAWDEIALDRPFPLLAASVEVGGSQTACATAAAEALLRVDTAASGEAASRRFFAQMVLFNASLARGRAEEAVAGLDAYVARWHEGTSLYLIAAVVHPALAERAREVAREDAQRFGETYRRMPFHKRMWALGVWAAHDGRPDIASTVAEELESRAGESGDLLDGVMAASLRAHVALARGDSTRAFQLLDALVPAAAPTDRLKWDEALPLGAERLALARILMARGDPREALEVAEVFDAAWPVIHPLYLRPSLELRADAAEALGDRRRAELFRARLAALESGG